MKRFLLSLIAVCCSSVALHAQDDDVYFVPSRSASQASEPVSARGTAAGSAERTFHVSSDVYAESRWAEGRGNGMWDVDEYNRRGARRVPADSMEYGMAAQEDSAVVDGNYGGGESYAVRLVRFHTPGGVLVRSPYYAVVCGDLFWDDALWTDVYWGWNYGGWWGYPWYHGPWGWNAGWGWAPGWGWGFGPHWGWHPGWGWGGHYPSHNNWAWGGGRNVRRTPSGDYVYHSRPGYGNRGGVASRYGAGGRTTGGRVTGNRNYRPSRDYGTSTPSRNGNANYRPSRNERPSVGTTPSRTTTTPSRPASTPSRSFGNSSGSVGGRSGGVISSGHSGGGRSFGGGGGARGGRR